MALADADVPVRQGLGIHSNCRRRGSRRRPPGVGAICRTRDSARARPPATARHSAPAGAQHNNTLFRTPPGSKGSARRTWHWRSAPGQLACDRRPDGHFSPLVMAPASGARCACGGARRRSACVVEYNLLGIRGTKSGSRRGCFASRACWPRPRSPPSSASRWARAAWPMPPGSACGPRQRRPRPGDRHLARHRAGLGDRVVGSVGGPAERSPICWPIPRGWPSSSAQRHAARPSRRHLPDGPRRRLPVRGRSPRAGARRSGLRSPTPGDADRPPRQHNLPVLMVAERISTWSWDAARRSRRLRVRTLGHSVNLAWMSSIDRKHRGQRDGAPLEEVAPATMRAWVLKNPNELELATSRRPARSAEVLVRIDAVAICATDLEVIGEGPPALVNAGRPSTRVSPRPRVHGTSRNWAPRRRVPGRRPLTVEIHAGCGAASAAGKACTRPATTTAPTTPVTTRATGPTASPPTRLRSVRGQPRQHLVRVPDSMTDEDSRPGRHGGDLDVRLHRTRRLLAGESVVVIGPGPIGCWGAATAKAWARTGHPDRTRKDRLAIGAKLGADHTIDSTTEDPLRASCALRRAPTTCSTAPAPRSRSTRRSG